MKPLDGKIPFIMCPPRSRGLVEKSIVSNRECVWPDCYGVKAMYGVPLCKEHSLEVFDQVILNHPRGFLEARQNGAIAVEQLRQVLHQEELERRKQRIKDNRTWPGWVYYIRIDGGIKIGWTQDVEKRTKAYPPSSELLATHPGTRELETRIHRKFAHLRTKGREWFMEDPALAAHIAKARLDFPDHQEKAYEFKDARGESKPQPAMPRSYR